MIESSDALRPYEPAALPWQEINAVLQSFARCEDQHKLFRQRYEYSSDFAAIRKRLKIKTDIDCIPEACRSEASALRQRLVILTVSLHAAKYAGLQDLESDFDETTGFCTVNAGDKKFTKQLEQYMAGVHRILNASSLEQQQYAAEVSESFLQNYSVHHEPVSTKQMRAIVSDPDYQGNMGEKRRR